ncbi:hypothetical protein HYV31_04240 [candidate division WWE3 bacterium]|nr:hypothetical protein [candidate division WWE3 bacterium]
MNKVLRILPPRYLDVLLADTKSLELLFGFELFRARGSRSIKPGNILLDKCVGTTVFTHLYVVVSNLIPATAPGSARFFYVLNLSLIGHGPYPQICYGTDLGILQLSTGEYSYDHTSYLLPVGFSKPALATMIKQAKRAYGVIIRNIPRLSSAASPFAFTK